MEITYSGMQDQDYTKQDLARGVDYIGVSCAFLCHDGAGKFLFHKRSAVCRDEQNRWDCGGGALEFGETFEDAVRREVKEEYGVEARSVVHLGSKNVIRDNGRVITHWVAQMHLVEVDPTSVIIGEPRKMESLGWFPLDALPEPMHSQVVHSVSAAREFFKKNA